MLPLYPGTKLINLLTYWSLGSRLRYVPCIAGVFRVVLPHSGHVHHAERLLTMQNRQALKQGPIPNYSDPAREK